MEYSEKVMDHFMNPRNVGEIENPSGVGEVGNPSCGDVMRFYLQIKDGVIEELYADGFRRLLAAIQNVPHTSDTVGDLVAVGCSCRA